MLDVLNIKGGKNEEVKMDLKFQCKMVVNARMIINTLNNSK